MIAEVEWEDEDGLHDSARNGEDGLGHMVVKTDRRLALLRLEWYSAVVPHVGVHRALCRDSSSLLREQSEHHLDSGGVCVSVGGTHGGEVINVRLAPGHHAEVVDGRDPIPKRVCSPWIWDQGGHSGDVEVVTRSLSRCRG